MATIINHKYENDELMFEVCEDGKKKWVKGSNFTEDISLIHQYWDNYSKKSNDEALSTWNLSQVIIPPPTKILEVTNLDDVPHALCLFDTFDTPVYVPTRFLRNSYPSILVKYFEDNILANPDKYTITE